MYEYDNHKEKFLKQLEAAQMAMIAEYEQMEKERRKKSVKFKSSMPVKTKKLR